MFSPRDIPFLTAIAERPEDGVLWKHFAQWLAERGELDTSIWLNRDWGMIRRVLLLDWHRISALRHEAASVSEYAVQILDWLLPVLRWQGSAAHLAENLVDGGTFTSTEF